MQDNKEIEKHLREIGSNTGCIAGILLLLFLLGVVFLCHFWKYGG